MAKWTIDKQFDACFGHRVYNQSLNVEYSLDSCLACRHFHGHQAKIKLYLTSDNLVGGMVTDFKHTNIFKKWVDDVIDHKFLIAKQDPLFSDFLSHYSREGLMDESLFHRDFRYNYWKPNLEVLESGDIELNLKRALYEKYEGIVVVDFVPTSENLCKWWCEVAGEMLKNLPNIQVSRVEYWETPKSHCEYSPT